MSDYEFFPSAAALSNNISSECEDLISNFTLKIFDDLQNSTFKSYDVTVSLCDEIKKKSTLENTQANENCGKVTECFACIKENLQKNTDDYEISMLHAMAVNSTIIDFRLWEYFKVSSKVEELVNDANVVKSTAIEDCTSKKICIPLNT